MTTKGGLDLVIEVPVVIIHKTKGPVVLGTCSDGVYEVEDFGSWFVGKRGPFTNVVLKMGEVEVHLSHHTKHARANTGLRTRIVSHGAMFAKLCWKSIKNDENPWLKEFALDAEKVADVFLTNLAHVRQMFSAAKVCPTVRVWFHWNSLRCSVFFGTFTRAEPNKFIFSSGDVSIELDRYDKKNTVEFATTFGKRRMELYVNAKIHENKPQPSVKFLLLLRTIQFSMPTMIGNGKAVSLLSKIWTHVKDDGLFINGLVKVDKVIRDHLGCVEDEVTPETLKKLAKGAMKRNVMKVLIPFVGLSENGPHVFRPILDPVNRTNFATDLVPIKEWLEENLGDLESTDQVVFSLSHDLYTNKMNKKTVEKHLATISLVGKGRRDALIGKATVLGVCFAEKVAHLQHRCWVEATLHKSPNVIDLPNLVAHPIGMDILSVAQGNIWVFDGVDVHLFGVATDFGKFCPQGSVTPSSHLLRERYLLTRRVTTISELLQILSTPTPPIKMVTFTDKFIAKMNVVNLVLVDAFLNSNSGPMVKTEDGVVNFQTFLVNSVLPVIKEKKVNICSIDGDVILSLAFPDNENFPRQTRALMKLEEKVLIVDVIGNPKTFGEAHIAFPMIAKWFGKVVEDVFVSEAFMVNGRASFTSSLGDNLRKFCVLNTKVWIIPKGKLSGYKLIGTLSRLDSEIESFVLDSKIISGVDLATLINSFY